MYIYAYIHLYVYVYYVLFINTHICPILKIYIVYFPDGFFHTSPSTPVSSIFVMYQSGQLTPLQLVNPKNESSPREA